MHVRYIPLELAPTYFMQYDVTPHELMHDIKIYCALSCGTRIAWGDVTSC
jgi:hypothetical protein